MKCKNCQAELPEGVTLCPECGTENPVKEKMSTSKKLTIVIIALVVLIAVLVGVIVMGMGGMGSGTDDTTPDTTAAAEATTPPDGNPDDETCKGTYTAEGDTVMAIHDEVIATMGDYTLTNGQLQLYYWMGVYNFLNYNSSYLSYYGLNPAQSLDTQVCTANETQMTWQQYFLAEALSAWQRYQALAHEAEAAQFQLDEEYAEELKTLRANMDKIALEEGYADVQEMLADQMGGGCLFEDYESYMNQYYKGYLYYASLCDDLSVTDEEVKAFYDEHKDEYSENGLTDDQTRIDVRHILLQPEGCTIDSSNHVVATEEQWEACRASAQAMLDQWLAEDGTEEGFAELAKKHTADGNGEQGGLYEDVYEGDMVATFNDWCFDETRQPGDSGLVKTEFGYHIMYFVNSELLWPVYAEADLLTSMQNDLLDETVAKYPIEVDYSKILIAPVTLVSES